MGYEWTIAVGVLFMLCFWGFVWYCNRKAKQEYLRKKNDVTRQTVIPDDARYSVELHTVSYSVSGLGGHCGADGGGADGCG